MAELLSAYPPGIWAILLATGVVIGLLAGFLGIGGGVVAVPVLLEIFEIAGVAADAVVPMAVGTAQASILVASLTAAGAHWRAGSIDRELTLSWLPALMVGTVLGLLASPLAPARLLTTLFAAVAAGLAVKLAVGDRLVLARSPPRGLLGQVAPTLVGGLASAVGIGGGTLSTPVLSLFSIPIKRAIGAGALFNLLISLPATLVFLLAGGKTMGRPVDAQGDVAVFCVAALSLPALFVAPAAARWSARAPTLLLQRLFAVCLAAIAARMLLK